MHHKGQVSFFGPRCIDPHSRESSPHGIPYRSLDRHSASCSVKCSRSTAKSIQLLPLPPQRSKLENLQLTLQVFLRRVCSSLPLRNFITKPTLQGLPVKLIRPRFFLSTSFAYGQHSVELQLNLSSTWMLLQQTSATHFKCSRIIFPKRTSYLSILSLLVSVSVAHHN